MKLLSFAIFVSCTSALASIPKGSISSLKQFESIQSKVNQDSFTLHASTTIEPDATIIKKRGGDATIAASTFNLAKSIIGAGVLSLPR